MCDKKLTEIDTVSLGVCDTNETAISENLPFFTIPDQSWGFGWEAGASMTLTLGELCPRNCEKSLTLCLRITYDYKGKADGKDYVTNYDSLESGINEISGVIHQAVDKLVNESVEGSNLSVSGYSYGLTGQVYVVEYTREDSSEIRVFYHYEDVIKWRDEIAGKRWGERFTDNPPVGKNVADEYFDRLAFVGDYSEVFTVTPSVLEI